MNLKYTRYEKSKKKCEKIFSHEKKGMVINMKKTNSLNTITLNTLITIILGMIAIIILMYIGPLRGITNTKMVTSGAENNRKTGGITEEIGVLQFFVPQHSYLKSIGILIGKQEGVEYTGELVLVVAKEDLTECSEVIVPISEISSNGYYDIPINKKVTKGSTYCYSIMTRNTGQESPVLVYRSQTTAGPSEHIRLNYGGQDIPDGSLAVRYYYKTPLRLSQFCVYLFGLLFLSMALAGALRFVLGEKGKTICLKVPLIVRMVCSIAWLWFIFVAVNTIFIFKIFGGTSWDLGVYAASLITGTLTAAFLIWKAEWKLPIGTIGDKFVILIRTFGFAFYFIMFAFYFNSGVNYGHYLGIRYMYAAFGLVMVTLFHKKQIFSIWNLVYSIIYGGTTTFWLVKNTFDIDTRHLHIVAVVAGWLWGMVIIATIINICKKRMRTFSIPFSLVIGTFLTLIVVFRNTRTWPIMLLILFGLFYVQKIEEEKMSQLFHHLCNGALFAFYYFVINSLLFRPYYAYNFARYPAIFASVAVWGIFLTFVFIFAYAKVIINYKKNSNFKNMCFSYIHLSVVIGYILLSISRTAIYSCSLIVIVTSIVMLLTSYEKKVRSILKPLVCVLAIVIVLFPVVYSATRCFPAVVNRPKIHLYEEFDGTIFAGELPNSPKYMNFKKALGDIGFRVTIGIKQEETLPETEMTEAPPVAPLDENKQIVPENKPFVNESENEFSNGRIKIFKAYLEQLNLTGHDVMWLKHDGKTEAHAHNTFIQSAYDHGVITGIIFIIVGAFGFVRAILYIKRKTFQNLFTVVPLIVIIGFGVVGMTEWIFHPSNPLTFALLFVIAPLLSPLQKETTLCKK